MTIRQFLRRRVTWAYLIGIAGGLALWVAHWSRDEVLAEAATIFGVVAVVGGVLFLNFALRCPKCKGNLAVTAVSAVYSVWGKRRVKFCQYCGVSIDERVSEKM